MAKRNRDDFSAQVKQTLASRVGSRCSNPDCRVPTTGPTTKPSGVSNIGKAAHIAGASAGGPRYDATMTHAQRSGIANGIWLCSICADKIDKDVPKYSVEHLHTWRQQAEALAQEEQGKRQPSEREVMVYRTKALGANVTGKSIGELITGVNHVAVQEIERLDPRFTAKISIDQEGTPIISLNPLETVSCKLCIPLDAAEEFSKKLADLENHGHRLELTAAGIRIDGTPLFGDTSPEKVVMETHLRRKALQRINWSDVQSGKQKTAEFIGQVIGGTESFTFRGKLFDGLYRLTYQVPMTASGMLSVNVEGEISFSSWGGRTVSRLPYFDQLVSLCEAISQGQKIDTSLEVDGQELAPLGGLELLSHEDAIGILGMLGYISRVRDIVKALGIDIPFQTTVVSADDIEFVFNVWLWVCHVKSLRGKELGLVTATITPYGEPEATALRTGVSAGNPMAVKVVQDFNQPLNLVGQLISLSGMTTLWTSVVPRVDGPLSSISAGTSVRLQLVPTDECRADVIVGDIRPSGSIVRSDDR